MNTIKSTSSLKRGAAIFASAIALSISLIPTSAEAVEAPLALASAYTYGVLANTTITTSIASTLT